jgi:hypothetical protein
MIINPLTLFSLFQKYRHARSKWIAAGRPLRSDERIAEIWDTHCKNCPNREADHCKLCGCFIKRHGTTLNKIAWASEDCPAGLWSIDIIDKEVQISANDLSEIEQLEASFEDRIEYIADEPKQQKKTPLSPIKQEEKGCWCSGN